jgi:hypothetical protein
MCSCEKSHIANAGERVAHDAQEGQLDVHDNRPAQGDRGKEDVRGTTCTAGVITHSQPEAARRVRSRLLEVQRHPTCPRACG